MQAVQRTFLLLNTIAAEPAGLSLSELSEKVNLAKSTTSRFLQSLEDVGAVRKMSNKYAIGLGIVSLAASMPHTNIVQALAYPTLLDLADKSRETVHLGIREGHKLCYVEQINTPHRVQLETWLNQCYPLHLTAAGKLFLAYANKDLLETYLSKPLEAYSSNSITSVKQLKTDLEKIRQRGYAKTKQEFSEDISGFAAGIFSDDELIASISISGPSFRFPVSEAFIIDLLKDASTTLSQKLGHSSYEMAS